MERKSSKNHQWQILLDQEKVSHIVLDHISDQNLIDYFRSLPEWTEVFPAGRVRVFYRLTKNLVFPHQREIKENLNPYPFSFQEICP